MRKIDILVEITTTECKVKMDSIYLASNMDRVQLETQMFKVDIWIAFKITNNWLPKDVAWIKMDEVLETKIRVEIWTFWKSFDTIFTIGYVTAIKPRKWIIQLKLKIKIKTKTLLKNKTKVKTKWAWLTNNKRLRILLNLKNTKINNIFKMQPKIIKAILLEWFKATNSKKIQSRKMVNKIALNQWFHLMMQKVNLKAKRINRRKRVINIWFCKWDKATMNYKIKCSFNIWVKMHLQYSITQAPSNFKCRSKCFILWRKSLETWRPFYHRKKILWIN